MSQSTPAHTPPDPQPDTDPDTKGGIHERPGKAAYAGFGLVSTLVGVAAAHLLASLLNPDSSPVLAVGGTVIDATPTPMKEWAIRTFGNADKPILIGSVMLGVLVLAAVAGVLTRRKFRAGATMLVLLVAIPATAALTRPGAALLDVLPSLLAGGVALGTLRLLDRLGRRSLLAPADESDGVAHRGASRRGVLIGTGAMVVLAAALGGAGRLVTNLRSKIGEITYPTPASPAGDFPTGLEEKYPEITRLRIPADEFYRVDTRLDTPLVDIEGWTLTIDGDVEQELTFTFDDLLEMPLIERDITLTCVSNSVGGPYVGGARWIGVRLTDLLDMAGVGSKADQILSTDFDGMTIGTPLDLATDGRDAMIALGMNGGPLPREHGYPARMVVPGLYGFISATKWITRITLTTYEEVESYWTQRDWAEVAPIKASARIDTPKALQEVAAGKTIVGGVAWAQAGMGVQQVQVKIDGGAWQDATMGPDVNNVYWRQWFYEWDATEGRHSVSARVITGSGEEQISARAEPFPEGSSGIQTLIIPVA